MAVGAPSTSRGSWGASDDMAAGGTGGETPTIAPIDGGSQGSVVSFRNGEGKDAVLEGFTLTNGTGTADSEHGRACGGGVGDPSPRPTRFDY